MASNAKYVNATESTFDVEVMKSTVPVLVDFWAPWCKPCLTIAPVLEQLAADYEGVAKIVKVNVDENQGLAQRFGVFSIPTLLFFRDGQVVDQLVGALPKEQLAKKLDGLVVKA